MQRCQQYRVLQNDNYLWVYKMTGYVRVYVDFSSLLTLHRDKWIIKPFLWVGNSQVCDKKIRFVVVVGIWFKKINDGEAFWQWIPPGSSLPYLPEALVAIEWRKWGEKIAGKQSAQACKFLSLMCQTQCQALATSVIIDWNKLKRDSVAFWRGKKEKEQESNEEMTEQRLRAVTSYNET